MLGLRVMLAGSAGEMKAIGIRQAVISCLNPLRFSKYQLSQGQSWVDRMLPTT